VRSRERASLRRLSLIVLSINGEFGADSWVSYRLVRVFSIHLTGSSEFGILYMASVAFCKCFILKDNVLQMVSLSGVLRSYFDIQELHE
jgi:hypothetical protein